LAGDPEPVSDGLVRLAPDGVRQAAVDDEGAGAPAAALADGPGDRGVAVADHDHVVVAGLAGQHAAEAHAGCAVGAEQQLDALAVGWGRRGLDVGPRHI
jgi:hypothetical protein